jgi:hypothetical protein
LTGKTEVFRKKPVPVPFCPPQIPHGLTRGRTRASAVRGRRLTAWAMARPILMCYKANGQSKASDAFRYWMLRTTATHVSMRIIGSQPCLEPGTFPIRNTRRLTITQMNGTV